MNKDEINRYIHVEIMGKCWHDLVLGNDDVWRCNEIDCKLEVRNYGGMHGEPKGNPDYYTPEGFFALLDGLKQANIDIAMQQTNNRDYFVALGRDKKCTGTGVNTDLPTALVEAAIQAMEASDGSR